jgi:hypothetical protein
MRVFYLGQNIKPEGLQSVLARLQARQPDMKSAVCDFAGALIVRGSAGQMAQAERSIRSVPGGVCQSADEAPIGEPPYLVAQRLVAAMNEAATELGASRQQSTLNLTA